MAQSYPSYPTPVTFEEKITVTATGEPTEAKDVPAPTTVISRAEIEDSQAENAADILRRVPGMTIMQSGNEGKAISAFTRGTNSNQTLVLFDGVRLNTPYFGGYDLSLLTTSGLERLEVARGPYSALWGADAIGGVINAIPRNGHSGFNMTLFGEGGETGWRRLNGDLTLGGKHLDLYLAGLYREGDGELENDSFKTTQGLLNVGWNFGKASRLAAVVQNVEVETDIPFATPGVPSPNRRQKTEQQLVAIPLRWALGEKWHLQLTASQVERTFTFSDPDDAWGLTDSTTNADTSGARLASNHIWGSHTVSWGGEWREDEVTAASNFGTDLDRVTDEIVSAFLQDVWQMGKKVQLILGARWDDTESWGSQTSPRFHIGWKLSATTELRAGYGEAFRQPSLGELYFPVSGNAELLPETSKSWELDFVMTPKSGKTRLQLNLFSTDLENLIEFDYLSYTSQNIGTAEIRGVELVMESALTSDFSQLIQVTWTDTRGDSGEQLLRRPEWGGSYTLTGSMWEGIRGDLTLIYVGARDDIDPTTFERIEVGGFATLDLAVAWQISKTFEITGRAINLLDREYQEVRGYPAPRRRFMAGIRLRL
jgi:vitamin B12 transporter